MTANARQVLDEALRLPEREREQLAEKLVESLVAAMDPEIEKAHWQMVQERQANYRAGKTVLVDGDDAMKQIRSSIRR